jgi:hypothetical protein
MELPELYAALKRCNRTELAQLCKETGREVHPTMSTEGVLLVLVGEEQPVANPIDTWRDAIMDFVLANWDKVRPQITCPAISQSPKACHGCSDMRVVACLTTSSDRTLEEIQNAYDRRKRSA